MKISIFSLSRAYARTHITGVFVFLLSQVSQGYMQCAINQVSTVCFWWILINKGLKGRKHIENASQKSFLFLFRPSQNGLFFHQNFSFVWHLWQQKINIAVGRRARTRVRETKNTMRLILSSTLYKTRMQKNILSLFPWFFTLWSYIDSYPYRDWLDICCSYVIRQKQRKQWANNEKG